MGLKILIPTGGKLFAETSLPFTTKQYKNVDIKHSLESDHNCENSL